MKTDKPLIQRYTILRGKLDHELELLEVDRKFYTLLSDDVRLKQTYKQIRLHREALALLEDTFNGEEE